MRHILLAAAALTVLALGVAQYASASCLQMTAAEQRARARVVFDGVALEGATATGIQHFRVTRYLKGAGPTTLRVSTGNVRRSDGSRSITSISIVPKRGERWRILARGKPAGLLYTNLCDGSHRR